MDRSTFFKTLYQFNDEGRLELRAFCGGKPNQRLFCAVDDCKAIDRFCAEFKDYNIFFGVGTRDDTGSGGKDNVVEIPALWADVDFKDIGPAAVKDNLDRFPYRPSIAILTGHGCHFYWVLGQSVSSEDFAVVEDILRRICAAMSADPAACEVARVLRVPGTMNVKANPALVKIHWLESFRYELSDFDILPEAPAVKLKGNGKSINPPGWMVRAFEGVPEGGNEHFSGRDMAGAKIVGYFVNDLSKKKIIQLLECWNIRNQPPLKKKDLIRIVHSVSKYRKKSEYRSAENFEVNLHIE